MYLGISKITRLGTIPEPIKLNLLKSTYFINKTRENQGKFLYSIDTPIDKAVIELINILNIDIENFTVEYWFQYQKAGERLTPHCDYNTRARKELPTTSIQEFLKDKDLRYYISPMTVAAYLEVSDNLIGGELCISNDFTYLSDNITNEKILTGSFEEYSPVEGDILCFEGSKYYHWISQVLQGTRKSLLLNFWPKDIATYGSQ